MPSYIIDDTFDVLTSVESMEGDTSCSYRYGISTDPDTSPYLNGTPLTLYELSTELSGETFQRIRIEVSCATDPIPSLEISYHPEGEFIQDIWPVGSSLRVVVEKDVKEPDTWPPTPGGTWLANYGLHNIFRMRITVYVDDDPFPVFVYRKIETQTDRYQWTANLYDLSYIPADDTQALYRWPSVDLIFDDYGDLLEAEGYILADLRTLASEYETAANLPESQTYYFD